MSDWSGQEIGGYQLAEEIGRGGAAVVYRAYQPQLERWVAIKVLSIQKSGGRTDFLDRFRREARAIAALRHPNIVNIYNYGEERGLAYIVMEYIAGGSLKTRMRGSPMPCPEALDMVIPVADALAYAHSQNIIHRDVKPGNVLLARADWPLLADFGLVKVIGHGKKITQPGAVMGTVVYLSPEQISGGEVDLRTDVYSLGVVLYELLTGKLPFQAESPVESMMMRMYQPPKPPRQLVSEIPASLETVLLRALEQEIDARYASMEALINDLRRVSERFKSPQNAKPAAGATARMITTRLQSQESLQGAQLFIATSGIALPIPNLDEVTVGRRDPMQQNPPDVDLEPYGGGSAGVSRHHARLLKRSEGWFLEDQQSTNGTFLNEVRLLPHRPVRLRSGDIVRFAQMTMVFSEE